MGAEAKTEFIFTGLRITQAVEGIHISQHHCTRQICPTQISDERAHAADMPLAVEEQKDFKFTVGELLWVATQTLPDLAFPDACLAGAVPDATIRHLVEANRQTKKARSYQSPILIRTFSSDPLA